MYLDFPIFLDSIDTATALQHMQSLVKLANVYIGNKKQEGLTATHSVLNGIAKYLTRMLKIFGANDGEQDIGFPVSGIGGSENVRILLRFYLEPSPLCSCLCSSAFIHLYFES